MSLFANAKVQDDIQTKDTLGGFKLLDSDVYLATIKLAYATPTTKGGMNLNLELDIDGHTHQETLFVMNKKKENFYVTKDGNKNYYVGFNHANDIALFATGKNLSETKTEDKVIEVYNYDQQAKVPTKLPVLTDLLGKQVKVAIVKQVESKKKQVNGEWVATEETKETNKLDKVFSPKDNRTSNEVIAKKDTAEFMEKWLDKNKGTVKDNTSKATNSTQPQAQPVASLFA